MASLAPAGRGHLPPCSLRPSGDDRDQPSRVTTSLRAVCTSEYDELFEAAATHQQTTRDGRAAARACSQRERGDWNAHALQGQPLFDGHWRHRQPCVIAAERSPGPAIWVVGAANAIAVKVGQDLRGQDDRESRVFRVKGSNASEMWVACHGARD
jgi:hypothetical protein